MNIIVSRNDIGVLLYRGYERARIRAGDKPHTPELWNNIAELLCVEGPRLSHVFVAENEELLIRRADDYDDIGRFLRMFYRRAKRLPNVATRNHRDS